MLYLHKKVWPKSQPIIWIASTMSSEFVVNRSYLMTGKSAGKRFLEFPVFLVWIFNFPRAGSSSGVLRPTAQNWPLKGAMYLNLPSPHPKAHFALTHHIFGQWWAKSRRIARARIRDVTRYRCDAGAAPDRVCQLKMNGGNAQWKGLSGEVGHDMFIKNWTFWCPYRHIIKFKSSNLKKILREN